MHEVHNVDVRPLMHKLKEAMVITLLPLAAGALPQYE
jgi:hypothetical protein